ncbi:hypothetical protein BYT27DRAFT_7119390, partial [Phlegmacium glaucopus]
LAYIEWYSPLPSQPDKSHGMYINKKTLGADGKAIGAVIPLSNIHQCCMLFPKFSDDSDTVALARESNWEASNVLDEASVFFFNNWLNMYAYQTIW